ncbi:MAG: RNA polymerase sigma factor [Myxococcota bacterium]
MIGESSDEALLRRYQAKGDVQAFELLVLRHRRALFNFIARFVGSQDKAEDLLQDVLVKLATLAADYQGRASVRTWLFTIARNLACDEMRKAKHRDAVSLDAAAAGEGASSPLVERLAGDAPAPDRAAASAMLQPVLAEAIASLPDDQREVFLLREYGGVPFKEIAEVTGTGVNTIKSRMRYALEGLRRALEERGVGRGETDSGELAGEATGS